MMKKRACKHPGSALSILMLTISIACGMQPSIAPGESRSSQDGDMEPPSQGWILYRQYALDYPGKFDFFMMEVGSHKVQELGRFTSVPSWSPRGRFFATGAIESSKLLIWDANTLMDIWRYPPSGKSAPDVRKIDLPDACLSRVQHNPKSKITSISWSSDGASLAIVCSAPEDRTSDVCIVPLDNRGGYCWDEFPEKVFRVVWSPTEDILAVSFSMTIKLVSPDGTHPTDLVDGWNPEWSPDGKQIVFSGWDGDVPDEEKYREHFPGIAVVDVGNKSRRWLYRAEDHPEELMLLPECTQPVVEDGCAFTWSPDGKSVAFAARLGSWDNWQIYRLDVETGEIEALTNGFSDAYSAPDWGYRQEVSGER